MEQNQKEDCHSNNKETPECSLTIKKGGLIERVLRLLSILKNARIDLVKQMERDKPIKQTDLILKLQDLVNSIATNLLGCYRVWQLHAIETSKDVVSAVSLKRDICIISRIQYIVDLPLDNIVLNGWGEKIHIQKLFDAIDELKIYIAMILKYSHQ